MSDGQLTLPGLPHPAPTEPRSFSADRANLALLSGGMVGLWDSDLKSGLVFGDGNFARIYGVDPARAQAGVPRGGYTNYVHPDDLEAVRADLASLFEGAEVYSNEHRIFHPTLGLRWILTRGRLIRDADGEPARFSGVSIDITGRRQVEARQAFLLDLSDRLRALDDPQAMVRAAVVRLGEHLAASRVGYGRVLPDDVKVVIQAVYTEADAPVGGEVSMAGFGAANIALIRGGGTLVWNDVREDPSAAAAWDATDVRACVCAPVMREDRMTALLFVHHREPRLWDLADLRMVQEVVDRLWEAMERSRSEAALRALNESLEQVIEERTRDRDRTWRLSPVMMLVFKACGTVLEANPAWSEGLGWTLEETLGRNFADFIAPKDEGGAAMANPDVAAGKASGERTLIMRSKGGPPRSVLWTTVQDHGRVYAFGRDVTAQTLAEERLRQAQRLEALGQLTGGIAHDFNNLLQGVTGSLDLIRLKASDAAVVRRWAEAGLQAAERGSRLTNQLLAFSRAQKLELQPVAVARLIAEMSELLERTLGPGVRMRFDLPEAPLAAHCDPTQLEMAVLNLAINARDAMDSKGDLTIAVGARRLTNDDLLSDGDYVEVSVRDSGPGMAPEIAARAFDPFFTTKPPGKGTGLGLSQVYASARQAGGAARIESAPGQGACVRLMLPRADGEPTQDPAAEAERGGSLSSPGLILVVDDDEAVRSLIASSLQALGLRTLEAEDGEAALRALSTSRPDLMILDFAMPGLTGADVAEAARAGRPDLPIIIASGHLDTAALSAVPGDPTPVLRKPFRLERLHGLVTQMLKASEEAAERPEPPNAP